MKTLHILLLLSLFQLSTTAYSHTDSHDHSSAQSMTSVADNNDIESFKKSITHLGAASMELLNKPMAYIEPGFGDISFVENNALDRKYLNQGFAMLHVFHYADALRSFKIAEMSKVPTIERITVYAQVGQIISYLKLDSRQGWVFAKDVVERLVTTLEAKDNVSQKELLWAKYAISYYASYNAPYSDIDNIEKYLEPSLRTVFDDMLAAFPNDVEVLTLASFVGNFVDESYYKKALEINPNHTGAHHYLVHLYEVTQPPRFEDALVHAKKLSELAPEAAHAVHMYGHILPQFGRYDEAQATFEKSDAIHKYWANKNGVEIIEDWHYPHNLHLWGATLFLKGEVNEAIEIFKTACLSDERACKGLFKLYLAYGMTDEAASLVQGNTTLQQSINQLDGLEYKALFEKAANVDVKKDPNIVFINLPRQYGFYANLFALINNIDDTNDSLTTELSDNMAYSFDQILNGQGFDAWATGAIEIVKTYQLAKSMGHNNLAEKLKVKIKALLPKVVFE